MFYFIHNYMISKKDLHGQFLEKLKKRAWEKYQLRPDDDRGIQKAIADDVGVTAQAVQSWFDESKDIFPGPLTLVRIYESMGLTPDYLLGVENKGKERKMHPIFSVLNLGMTEVDVTDFIVLPIMEIENGNSLKKSVREKLIIHKRIFGRRKNLQSVRLTADDQIGILIFSK